MTDAPTPTDTPEGDGTAKQKAYFRGLRKAGIRDAEIAERAGISRPHLSRMRHGRSPITQAVKDAVCSIQEDVRRIPPLDGGD